ncbi:MAG: histidine kinase [Eubacteriales bacterium]|nr:histidine kinase [Eubacteriales bacterium]
MLVLVLFFMGGIEVERKEKHKKSRFRWIISGLRRVHLIRRLQISSVMLPVITCLIIIFLMSISAYSVIRRNELEHVKMTEDMIQYNLNTFLESILTPLNALSTKTSFVSLVNDYNDVIENNNWSRYTSGVADEVFAYYADNTDIHSVEITGKQTSIISFPNHITAGNLDKSELMRTMMDSSQRIVSFGNIFLEQSRLYNDKCDKRIVVGVQIKSQLRGEVIGALFISIDSEKFLEKITMGMENSLYNIVISTAEGTPVAASICEDETGNLNEVIWNLPQENGEFLRVDHTRYLTCQSETKLLQWKVYILTNYDKMINRLIRQIILCILIAFLLVIVLSIITFFVSESVIQPINRLVNTMKKAELTTDTAYLEPDGADELTYLVKSFNEMSAKIHTLFLKNMEAQDQNRKIELDSLQAQINPHMLYNTLDSINWMAYLSGTNKICDIIQNLSNFYRLTLNQGKIFHTLEDELNQVECYLKLEQFVYDQAISYTIERNDNLPAEKIPRIILQPIVENAIMHGFTSSELVVKVATAHIPGYLLITVQDNGIGIPYLENQEIPVKEVQTNTESYGLNNIDERIRLIYGSKYGITLQNGQEYGLKVSVYLPDQLLSETEQMEEKDDNLNCG